MPKQRKRANKSNDDIEEPHFTHLQLGQALQRQIDAVRVVRDVEIENLVTELRSLPSYFSQEQLQKPLLQVFAETLPNLSVVVSGEEENNMNFDVKWKNKPDSFLQILSTNAGKKGFLGAHGLHSEDVVFEEPSDTQILAMQEALQIPCPGIYSYTALASFFKSQKLHMVQLKCTNKSQVKCRRLSVGMASKTFRQPKPGEMLHSIHGSPLGVFKENNMEAMHESGEG